MLSPLFGLFSFVVQGEAVIITRESVSRRQVAAPADFAPDIFEYVYFARPDSVLDGISVYRSRMAMGDALADEVRRVLAEQNLSVDVVIPVRITLPRKRKSYINAFCSGTRYIPGRSLEPRTKIATPLPRGVHQKSLCRSNFHYARTADA